MAKPIRYTLKRWDALTLVPRDGRAGIDNNAERAMRPMTLGRNYVRSRDRTPVENAPRRSID